MPNFLVNNNFYQGTSQACIVDLTPPTFAGINFLDVESRGQIRAGWSAATDATAPIRYEVYIKASTSSGLFSTTNIIAVTPNLQYDIFTLPDGSFLQNGTTYYVGVRAIDGVNNRDSNVVSQSVISTGVLTSIDIYESFASYSINDDGDFVVTAWANKNNNTAKSPNGVLGTASYQVFNKNGTAIVGMSGSGVSPNADGLFVFAPITNLLDIDHNHYEIRVRITVDGEIRENFIPILASDNVLDMGGVADINDSNQIVGSFWIAENSKIVTGSALGTGSYETYDAVGNLIVGLSQSGITADSNGFFIITPQPLGSNDITKAFVIKTTIEVNGENKSNYIILGNQPAVYKVRGGFSINSSNQLQGSFHMVKNDQQLSGVILGTGSYQVYDKNGVIVAGLNQSGITADANGYYHITPVSAILLTDLTHYIVKVEITVAGSLKRDSKYFSLLGT